MHIYEMELDCRLLLCHQLIFSMIINHSAQIIYLLWRLMLIILNYVVSSVLSYNLFMVDLKLGQDSIKHLGPV